MNDGFVVHGVDGSPSLTDAFRRRFPDAQLACEPIERSNFFGRTFDGVVAVGLLFLLGEDAQRDLIRRVASVVNPGGRFMFTSPVQACTWTDVLTGRPSRSLGADEYEATLAEAGLVLVGEYQDEGDAHYYDARRP